MANSEIREHPLRVSRTCYDCVVRDLAVLVLHLLATVARLAGPGGARSVMAESVLVKHSLVTTSLSMLGYDHDLDEPVIHLWNDIGH